MEVVEDHNAPSFGLHPIVFLSLGPGDPELLTLKAVRTLREADIVIVPATRDAAGCCQSRAVSIISEWCPSERQRVYALPMSHDRSAAMMVYDRIYDEASTACRQGKKVVVAVEGDVSIYASIHYVLDRLQSCALPVLQQPGIPSFIAAAARAGLSLASQQQRLTILPGQADTDRLHALLESRHVVVIMKLSQCQDAVKAFLGCHPTVRCHYFENVGLPSEYYTSDHAIILSRQMPYFSLAILSTNA